MIPNCTLIDDDCIKIEMDDRILIGAWKISFLDLEAAQKVVNSRLEATRGEKYPILIKINSIKDSSKEARDFLASAKGCEGIIAGGILVNGILENVMASLYIYLNRPVVPTKIFIDEAKAREWLAGFLKTQE